LPVEIARTYDDYRDAVLRHVALGYDAGIFSAGVADYRPRESASGKILGYLLPAGPLRESISKLNDVDIIVCNHKKVVDDSYLMKYKREVLINLKTNQEISLNKIRLKNIHAIAGIGNPDLFFNDLKSLGLVFDSSAYKDHYRFTKKDFKTMNDKNIIMTEKDAVKCEKFAQDNFWYLPVSAEINSKFIDVILKKLKHISHG
ncbi:MAG: tetraacyldisaccharide 4'-kinase, partial [Candidatus Methylopumilus sp.]